jgi:hypothetical protein
MQMIAHRERAGLNLPAVLPSVIVSMVHFGFAVLVGRQANLVIQHRFDTGEAVTGADAVVASVNFWLSIPIPAVVLAGHPAHDLSATWWIATALNSVIWGLVVYGCYRFSRYLFG